MVFFHRGSGRIDEFRPEQVTMSDNVLVPDDDRLQQQGAPRRAGGAELRSGENHPGSHRYDPDATQIEFDDGDELDAFANRPVTNVTPDTRPPSLLDDC